METQKVMVDHPLQVVANILTKAKQDCLLALEGQNQGTISITVDTALTSLVNRLSPMMGYSEITTTPVEQFAPVTDFMGTPIQRMPDVTKQDLTPTLTEKERFVNKVDDLVNTIRDRQAEAVISSFTIEPDVIRGAAKKAGLQDYADGVINIEFIERIKEGLTLQDTRAIEEEEINNELLSIENEVTGDVPTIATTTTDPLSTSRKQKQPK